MQTEYGSGCTGVVSVIEIQRHRVPSREPACAHIEIPHFKNAALQWVWNLLHGLFEPVHELLICLYARRDLPHILFCMRSALAYIFVFQPFDILENIARFNLCTRILFE